MTILHKLLGGIAALTVVASLSSTRAVAQPIAADDDDPVCYPVQRCFELCQTAPDGDVTCDLVCGIAYVCPGLGDGGDGGGGGGGIDMCDGLTGKDRVRCEIEQQK